MQSVVGVCLCHVCHVCHVHRGCAMGVGCVVGVQWVCKGCAIGMQCVLGVCECVCHMCHVRHGCAMGVQWACGAPSEYRAWWECGGGGGVSVTWVARVVGVL